METTLARHVAITAFRARQELTDLLEMMEIYGDPAEYMVYKKAAAAVDAQIDEVLATVFSAHEDVKQDIDAVVKKYGEAI